MGSSPAKPVLSEESKLIHNEVHRHPVVMYTKNHCPYCIKAKDELNNDGIIFVERNINEDSITNSHIKGLVELTRCRTVPQIFVCGRFIGGYTEMHALRPDLVKMIEQCSNDGVTYKPGIDTVASRI
ncbi:Glutaredoxin [Parelaphostrongylus tenuis]|uniref:Glutaredoxin n=1 Tax=Parelaphostrongylus tenuis TaxID=148309 RepID=A0AAD5RB03_PARTN|nr:Glutaredoxin [Parelaphostrongylus tenuis]